MASERTDAPQFSIVTAVYNVGRYLADFIDSVDRQTFPVDRFEVIAVDDGSTDDSPALLEAWRARRPDLVTVVTKPNGGQASARNAGLEVARGAWVTFTDPDDVVEPGYLSEVAAFLDEHPETTLVATNRVFLNDETGELTDGHPLRAHFAANRLVDPAVAPEFFHGSAPAAFFRREVLLAHGRRFDPQVRPNFEDGHFCCHYLLDAETPTIGFVATARYHYRKRQDASSTLNTSLADPDRYTKVLRNGYLDVLQRGAGETGTAPEWLQNFVVYELSYYFSSQERQDGAVTAAVGPVSDEFHELMGRIRRYLSDDVILGYSVRPLKRTWRYILLHAYDPQPWHQSYAVLRDLDEDQGLVKLTYYFTGELPAERYLHKGRPVEPKHAKIRDLSYHGRTLLRERVVWLSSRAAIRAELDGRPLDLRFRSQPFPSHSVRPGAIRRQLGSGEATDAGDTGEDTTEERLSLADRLVLRLAGTAAVRKRFGGAWVLMDRIHDADDSGEILFHHLRRERPDINAWFVLQKGTPAWERLRRTADDRLVAHGSLRWKLLMLNARHLVSSHADHAVIFPPELRRLGLPWRFTFLQHGVIKDDLSAWLNVKDISVFVTSTPAELASVAGDGNAYVYTTKETKLTGLPRFDKLLATAERFPPDKRDLLLVAPTWRTWLAPDLEVGTQRRRLDESFLTSEFTTEWTALLRSPELAEACRRHGLTLGFLAHPNFSGAVSAMDLPDHVRPLSWAVDDVQEYFARAAALVTDYSSVAFNCAYLDRPVVYFQFDAERMLSGAHVGRRGYFDYQRDGFGPVARTATAAVQHVCDSLEQGPAPTGEYRARVEASFPLRDGRCCARVTEAIERSTRPARARVPEPTPAVPGPPTQEGEVVGRAAR